MEQDWSEQYKIVWNIFLAHPQSVENGISRRGYQDVLAFHLVKRRNGRLDNGRVLKTCPNFMTSWASRTGG